MTNWLPDLSGGTGPLYLRLADSIESAIATGELPPGGKLPPQRNLAFDLKVTIGTVGRAYALVHERGLVSGEVGRGTYVLAPNNDASPTEKTDTVVASLSGTRTTNPPAGKIRFDTTAAPDVGQGEILGRVIGDIARDHPLEIASYSRDFPRHWLEAGQHWLSRNNWRPEIDNVVPTLGAHAAAIAVIAAVTSPGDKIVFENLTYTQVSRSARLLGRRTILANSDDLGLIPEDFERVCAQQHPKLAFLMPTAHNPTLAVIPADRRRAIAEIARRHGVWLIEDDLYGAMSGDDNPLLTEFGPERTFLVGGLSKSVSAGVRGGWVACPPHYSQRVRVAHKMMTGGISFALAETGARLVLSGAASELSGRSIAEIAERERIGREALAGFDFRSHPRVPFIWLKLPDPWLSGTFKRAAYDEGLLVDDEDEFKAARTDRVYHRVRIGFSSTPDRSEMEKGFLILRRLLENGTAGYDSFD